MNQLRRVTLCNEVKERAQAAYLALAIGDSLGAVTEFLTAEEIRQKHGWHQNLTGGGWLHLKPGQITDDTQMNLAVGQALIDAKGFDLETVAKRLAEWMASKPVDIGSTVRHGLRAYITHGVLQQKEQDWMAGNGAVMRLLPIVLASLNDLEQMKEWALAQAHITHANSDADEGLLLVLSLSHAAITLGQAAPLQTIALQWAEKHKKWDYRRFKRSIDGYIVNSVKTALYYFFNSHNLEECLTGIANAGGDTDTNCAIAAMFAGPFYGLDNIPKRWIKQLDKKVANEVVQQTNQIWEIFYECH